MLEDHRSEQRVSTGLGALDAVLGGLYWGDNVVWQLDSAAAEPFFAAIARRSGDFGTRTFVSLGGSPAALRAPGLSVIDAGPGSGLEHPADLLREIHRVCHPGGRRLLLFESLERMVEVWAASGARGSSVDAARCCWMWARSPTGL